MRPLLSHILNSILLVNPEDSSFVSQMKIKVKEDLGRRYVHLSQSLLDKCSYLDPRFRWKYGTKQEEVIYQLKMEAVEMLQKIDAQDVAAEVEVAVSETSEMPKQKKVKRLSGVLQHCLGTSSCCNNEEVSRVDREIKRYEDNPPVEISVEALD